MPIIKDKFFRLPETLNENELLEMIDLHDCKLSPDSGCDCVWWKEMLFKKTRVPNGYDYQALRQDYLHYS